MPASPPTLILGAMPSEVRTIQAQLEQRRSGTLACFPYDTGILRGRRVIVAVTGVGVTNGAMVAALFIQRFAPRELIVSGTGSRFSSMRPCDRRELSRIWLTMVSMRVRSESMRSVSTRRRSGGSWRRFMVSSDSCRLASGVLN